MNEPVVVQQQIEPGRTFQGRTVKSWAVVNNVPTYDGSVPVYLSIVRFSDGTKMYVKVRARGNPLVMGEGEKVAIAVGLAAGLGAILYYALAAPTKPVTVQV